MPSGKKRKRHKMSTHKRKKRLRKNRHKKEEVMFLKLAINFILKQVISHLPLC